MKSSSLFTFFVFCFVLNISAQVELVNLSSSEENAKFVFHYVDNLLYLENAHPDMIYDVKLNDVSLSKTESAQFTYSGPFTKENKFEIFENQKLIKTEVFSSKRVADPEIRVGTLETYNASIESILESPMFTIFQYDSYKMDRFISGYKMRILDSNGKLKIAFDPTKGANFTPEQIEMIATLNSGDQIEITELVYTDATRVSRKKNPFFITIK